MFILYFVRTARCFSFYWFFNFFFYLNVILDCIFILLYYSLCILSETCMPLCFHFQAAGKVNFSWRWIKYLSIHSFLERENQSRSRMDPQLINWKQSKVWNYCFIMSTLEIRLRIKEIQSIRRKGRTQILSERPHLGLESVSFTCPEQQCKRLSGTEFNLQQTSF